MTDGYLNNIDYRLRLTVNGTVESRVNNLIYFL
jgi:hypothetical protein